MRGGEEGEEGGRGGKGGGRGGKGGARGGRGGRGREWKEDDACAHTQRRHGSQRRSRTRPQSRTSSKGLAGRRRGQAGKSSGGGCQVVAICSAPPRGHYSGKVGGAERGRQRVSHRRIRQRHTRPERCGTAGTGRTGLPGARRRHTAPSRTRSGAPLRPIHAAAGMTQGGCWYVWNMRELRRRGLLAASPSISPPPPPPRCANLLCVRDAELVEAEDPLTPPPATSPVAWVRRFGQAAGGRRRAARRRRVSSIGGSRGGAAVWAQSRRAPTHHSGLSSVGDEARSGLGFGAPPGGEPHSEAPSSSLTKYHLSYNRAVLLLMSAIISGVIRVPLRGTARPPCRTSVPTRPPRLTMSNVLPGDPFGCRVLSWRRDERGGPSPFLLSVTRPAAAFEFVCFVVPPEIGFEVGTVGGGLWGGGRGGREHERKSGLFRLGSLLYGRNKRESV